jgi:transposase InsO family protein
MQKNNLVKGMEKVHFPAENPKCDHCPFGKLSVTPFLDKSKSAISKPLQVVCIDTAGPYTNSIGGKRYMLVFVDACTRYTWSFYLKERSEAPKCLKEFIALVERQSGHKIKAIRSDNAKEFVSGEFKEFVSGEFKEFVSGEFKEFVSGEFKEFVSGEFKEFVSSEFKEFISGEFKEICLELGIEQQVTAPYSSASNGIAERVLRTIQENGKAILHESGLSMGFWPEAFEYVVHTRNRSYHSGINDVPYKKWFGSPPNVANVHPFGCNVKYINHPKIRRKGEYHAHTGKFVGYYHNYPAFKVWNPHTRQFFKTRSLIFDDLPMQNHRTPYNAFDFDDNPHICMRSPMTTTPATAPIPPPAQIPSFSRFPSLLTDIEEVDGPLPSLVDCNIAPMEEHPLTQMREGAFYQTDERGYRIRPEEHPEHPEFTKFGRVGGRSQREKKPVNRLYIAEQTMTEEDHMAKCFAEFPSLLERINEAQFESDNIFYNTMHALLAEFNDFEEPPLDFKSASGDRHEAMLAKFNIWAKTYSYAEAMQFPEPRLSAAKEAIASEIKQLEDRGVWEEVEKPEHMDTYMDWQIIVDEKYDTNGNNIKTKARIVLRGDFQVEGRDFDETYTNTPSMATVRLTIALTSAIGSEPRQMDVVGAFLAAPINMDVYVKPLPNVVCSPGKVLKLRTALYGLRQSGREFTDYRDAQLRSIGYQNSPAQPSFFFRR